MNNDKKKVLVLGAGITGLTCAYVLSRRGFEVTILEKSGFVGGLAATFSHNKHLLDYGPHNFHTHIPGVLEFVRDRLGVPMNRLPVTSSKLFFMGKFVDYPIKIFDALKTLSLSLTIRCFLDYILTRIGAKLRLKEKNEDSFEAWVRNRFGFFLYRLYFGPYVKKVWGIPASEIDSIVARKRIPEPSLFSLIVRSLTGIKFGVRHSEDPSLVESYYPPKGIGGISKKLAEKVEEYAGHVELNCDIKEIASDSSGNNRILYSAGECVKDIRWDYLVNTIPINNFTALLNAPGKDRITQDAQRLTYRSIILLYMFLSVDKVFDDPWIYFNESDNEDLIFNRLYEVGGFSTAMLHEGKGIICLEITCYKGDNIWNSSDKELYDKCINYLEKNKFLSRSKVVEILTKRIEVAYPVFRKGYHNRLLTVIKYFTEMGNIFSLGRQGLFSYANMDHCIDMGLRIESLIKDGKLDSSSFLKNYYEFFSYK